ncbi:conserved hypothetical protein [Ricinus communis]|uniref:Uncharacterized protein n=1 Tax=Ricinus communis TaxID=3988 RepID=B9TAQ1_RICCO|nr:conserved hypothetical protein [Ricinus communis]
MSPIIRDAASAESCRLKGSARPYCFDVAGIIWNGPCAPAGETALISPRDSAISCA